MESIHKDIIKYHILPFLYPTKKEYNKNREKYIYYYFNKIIEKNKEYDYLDGYLIDLSFGFNGALLMMGLYANKLLICKNVIGTSSLKKSIKIFKKYLYLIIYIKKHNILDKIINNNQGIVDYYDLDNIIYKSINDSIVDFHNKLEIIFR